MASEGPSTAGLHWPTYIPPPHVSTPLNAKGASLRRPAFARLASQRMSHHTSLNGCGYVSLLWRGQAGWRQCYAFKGAHGMHGVPHKASVCSCPCREVKKPEGAHANPCIWEVCPGWHAVRHPVRDPVAGVLLALPSAFFRVRI